MNEKLTPIQLKWLLNTGLVFLRNYNSTKITEDDLDQLAEVCHVLLDKVHGNKYCEDIFLLVQECIQLEYERQLSCTTQTEK